MRAMTQHTLFCECNHSMSYVASAAGPLTVLQCANIRCEHYGKRFHAPTFELVEIVPEPPAVEDAESAGTDETGKLAAGNGELADGVPD